MKDAARKNIST